MATITGQAGTLLGPLTTVWTPPVTCTAMIPLCDNCQVGYMAQKCDADIVGAGPVRDNTACWPPVLAKHASPTHPFNGWGFYSPGIHCPTGYTSACTTEYQKRGDWPAQFSLVEGETAIGCCPSGFQCTNIYGNTCIQMATETGIHITIKTASCSGTIATAVDNAVYPTSVTRTVNGEVITELRTMTMFAPMIQMNFQVSDRAEPSTSTTAASSTNDASSINAIESFTLGSSGLASSTDESQTTTPTVNQSQGLAGGGLPDKTMDPRAKIGVIVGCVVGGFAVLTMIVWMLFKRRKHAVKTSASKLGVPEHAPYQQVHPQPTPPYPIYHQGYSQSWDQNAGVYEMEVPNSSVAELGSGQETPVELGSGQETPVELDKGQARPSEMLAYRGDEKKTHHVRK